MLVSSMKTCQRGWHRTIGRTYSDDRQYPLALHVATGGTRCAGTTSVAMGNRGRQRNYESAMSMDTCRKARCKKLRWWGIDV